MYIFRVHNTTTQSIILDIYFLTYHKAQSELEASKIVLKGALDNTDINFIQCEPSTHANPQMNIFHLAKCINLKPFHEYVIPFKANSPVTGDGFIILHGSLNKLQVAVVCCVTVYQCTHSIQSNESYSCKRLLKGTKIAIACNITGVLKHNINL